MKQRCEICGAEMDYKSRDEFIKRGYQAFQLGNKKAYYFCNNHKYDEVLNKIEKLILMEVSK